MSDTAANPFDYFKNLPDSEDFDAFMKEANIRDPLDYQNEQTPELNISSKLPPNLEDITEGVNIPDAVRSDYSPDSTGQKTKAESTVKDGDDNSLAEMGLAAWSANQLYYQTYSQSTTMDTQAVDKVENPTSLFEGNNNNGQ